MSAFVYIVQAGTDGPIKIGISDNVKQRLSGIQTDNHERVSLLAYRDGGRKEEYALHCALRRHHIHREWFRWNAVTQWVVEHFAAGRPVAEIVRDLEAAAELQKEVACLLGIATSKQIYRRHRRDPAYGKHYRRECSILIHELDQRRASHSEAARLGERALRAGHKLRAVSA